MSRSAAPEVVLAACPPWKTDCPNLALAYLAATLGASGIPVGVRDFNIELFQKAEPPLRRFWELTASTFWARPEVYNETFGPATRAFIEQFVAELADGPGRWLGFSAHSANVMFTLEVVRLVRQRGCRKRIVIGGPSVQLKEAGVASTLGLVGFKPRGYDDVEVMAEMRRYLDLVDVFVEAEGERTLLELVERERAGVALEETPGAVIWRKGEPAAFVPRPVVEDLDTLPAPSFEEFDLEPYTMRALPVLTSRGCVRKCAMCYERVLWPGFRHRSLGAIVGELRGHMERWGVRMFSCNDLLLNGDPYFLGRLCDALAESGLELQWWGNAVVHKKMDLAYFKRLRAGGLSSLSYGIESGSQRILDRMKKGYRAEDAGKVLRAGAEAGLNNTINLIVGFPGESEEDHRLTVQFVEEHHEAIHHVGVLATCIVFPHSILSREWEAFGLDASSLRPYNPFLPITEWRDTNGLDAATRQERFWELYRVIRGHGIGVTGVEDDEDLTAERIRELAGKLKHPTAWVREDAIMRLARATGPELGPVMLEAMDDPSFVVASQALLNLARIDLDQAWERASRLILRSPAWLDHAATLVLGKRTDGRSLDLLERVLDAERYSRHTAELRRLLAPHREIYEVFERFVDEARAGSASALQRLLCPWPWARRRGLRWLAEEAPETVLAGQVEELGGAVGSLESEERLLAVRTLARIPDAWTRMPAALLDDPCPRVRCEAVVAVWRGSAAIPAASEAPDRMRLRVRAREHVASADPALWPFEGREPHEREFLQRLAVRVVRGELLGRALREGPLPARLAALEALRESPDSACAEEVAGCLASEDAQVRRMAAAWLGRYGGRTHESRLATLLHDPDLFVSQESIGALARLRSPLVLRYFPGFLDEHRWPELLDFVRWPVQDCAGVRERAQSLAPQARAGDVSVLERAWAEFDAFGRVCLLATIRETGAIPQARAVVTAGLEDADPAVRVTAIEVLEAQLDPGMCPVLLAYIRDPDGRCRAASCRFLARARCESARPAFLGLLHDSDPEVREWAARGLGRLGHQEDVPVLRGLLEPAAFQGLSEEVRSDLEPLRKWC